MSEQQQLSVQESYQDTPTIPNTVYSVLPKLFTVPAAHYEKLSLRAKDMFFLSSLATIGAALKNPVIYHNSRFQYGSFYLLIAAPPMSFKSAISDAKGYTYEIRNYYHEQWRQKLSDYNMRFMAAKENKEQFNEPRPFEHYFYIPSKTNKPTLIQQLNSCPVNLMIANEASSIFGNFKQGGYADYKDILLNAWNNETIDDQTKTNSQRIMIETPRLGLITSTTPNQVFHLTGTGDDGLLSRFCVYVCVDDTPILNLYNDDGVDIPENAYTESKKYSAEVLDKSLWETKFRIRANRGQHLADTLNRILSTWKVGNPDNDNYKGIVGRSTITFGRMAMTMQLMAMRSYEPTMYIKDDIFEAALEILKVLLEHSYRMIVVENSRVPKEFVIPKPVLTEESLYSKFVSALPKEFTRTDAINIGIDLGMASGSVDVYISRMKKKGLATVENGKYIKQI